MARAADEEAARVYAELLERAREDPRALAFWLGGSRGMGQPTEHSDYDCFFIVAEDGYDAFKAELGLAGCYRMDWRPGIDLVAITFPMFETDPGWRRGYHFAHLKALVDKTGRAQPLIDAKARLPEDEVAPFVDAALDHALNQAYRGLKCLRDGDLLAGRLEAAEGVYPFLDAIFALHDGRLRPYFKYLARELRSHPLARLPMSADELLARLRAALGDGAAPALSRLLADCEPAFRTAGCAAAYDGWEGALAWILRGEPVGAP